MVTPISIVLRAATGIVTPYTADVGVAYRNTPYTTEKSRSHGGFLRRSQGHRQFSSAVTRSQAVFGRSQIVTPVACSKYGAYWSDHPLDRTCMCMEAEVIATCRIIKGLKETNYVTNRSSTVQGMIIMATPHKVYNDPSLSIQSPIKAHHGQYETTIVVGVFSD